MAVEADAECAGVDKAVAIVAGTHAHKQWRLVGKQWRLLKVTGAHTVEKTTGDANWQRVTPDFDQKFRRSLLAPDWPEMACTSESSELPLWADSDYTAPSFPESEEGIEKLHGYITRMQQETALRARLLREKGIPVCYEELYWESAKQKPFKCDDCTKRWNHLCCGMDTYKWMRDAEYIDDEDFERMLKFCPVIKHSVEPEEWNDDVAAADRKRKREELYLEESKRICAFV